MSATIYSTAEWRRARARVLARDEFRCTVVEGFDVALDIDADGNVVCVEVPIRCTAGPADGLDVHHSIPVEECDDPFDLNLLYTACDHHHTVWHWLTRENEAASEPTAAEMVEALLGSVRAAVYDQAHGERAREGVHVSA